MAVIRKEAYYTSDNLRSKIRTLIWADDKVSPIGVIQLVPSFGDHIGRYDAFARFLVSSGFIVCGNDHIGHGKSVSVLSELGAVLPGEHMSMLRDMGTLHRIMTKKNPGLPYYMIGFGVGSFMTRIYLRSFSNLLSGAVLIGTSQLPDWVSVFEDGARALLDRLPDSLSSAAALNVIFGKLTRRLYKDDSELSYLSSSDEALAAYLADPLTGFPQTKEMTLEMLSLLIKGSRKINAENMREGFPLMFLSGGKDSVGLFGRGVINASDLYMENGIQPEVVIYPVMRHEIIHENGREKIYEDVRNFLFLNQ